MRQIISSTDAATLISGFGGAALGGGISWLLARQAAREVSKKDERQRLDIELATASATSLKLLFVANGLHTLHKHFKDERANMPEARLHDAIRPVTGVIDQSVPFVASDFPTFFKVDRGDLANSALLLEPRYRSIISALKTYNEEHLQLQNMLAPYRGVGGAVGQPIRIQASEAVLGPILLKMNTLDGLIEKLISFVETDLNEATGLCNEWDELLFKQFGKKFLHMKQMDRADTDRG